MDTTIHPTKDPERFRAISINDPHFAASSPPAFKVDYLTYLEGQVDQVFRAAVKHDVDTILWGGDLFHLKEPRHNPHWLLAKVIAKLVGVATEAKLINLGIGGNHDYKYGSTETGLYGSPLDVVLESRQLWLLDKHEHLFVPDPHKADFTVRVAGGSYLHGRADHVRDKKKQDPREKLITIGHFWLGTQTGEFFGEPLFGFDYFKDCDADVIIVGHHHEDKGVVHTHGKYYVSQGSIGITGAHPHDLERKPAAALIEVTKDQTEVKMLRPKPRPIEELLDLEKREQLKEEKKEVDEFIQSLAQTQMEVADPMKLLEELATATEVKERALGYIAQAERA